VNKLTRLIARWPVERALLAACVLGLIALAIMIAGVLLGTPLPVVASMSVAQGVGVLACLIFGLSIVADSVARRGGGK
jgi:hypothetical protein